ncbi:MAG: CPBP family intramembrane metalloprotease [Candidatus Riflebacteria bacterium]|nr:CPBP family intramembrane metalloprotease [Candidatus Riflebacteria bacterium]
MPVASGPAGSGARGTARPAWFRAADALLAGSLWAGWVTAQLVPRPWLLTGARALAPLLARVLPVGPVRKNLRILRTYRPDLDDEQTELQLVTETVAHQLCTIVDLFKLVAQERGAVPELVEVVGWEHLEAARRDGHGIVLLGLHLGNWELAGAVLAARGVAVHAFYFEQLAPALDRFLGWARHRSRMKLLHQHRGLREGLRALKTGAAVGFVADQDGSRDGLFLDFLGHLVSMPRGPYEFARHASCALVPVSCRRIAGDRYRLELGQPLSVPTKEAVPHVARQVTAWFEEQILAAPTQWQLFYDRFWLRHIPRLRELGLLERAQAEDARDRHLARMDPREFEGQRLARTLISCYRPEDGDVAPEPPPAAESPGQSPPSPRRHLSQAELTRMAYLFYLPFALLGLGWMAYRDRLETLTWQGSFWLSTFSALAVAAATIVLSRFSTRCFSWAKQMETALQELLGPVSVPSAVHLAAVSAAAEELVFRGALQPELGLFWASLVFAVVHYPAEPRLRPWTLFAFVVGIALGLLFDATGGLFAPVLAHFAINAVNLSWLSDDARKAS